MKLLPFLIIFIVSRALAQEPTASTIPFYFGSWSGESYQIPEGDKAFVFADASNVRKEPKQNAEVLGKLFIGTQVKILERTTIGLTLNGIESSWVKVKFDTLVGYVWGGTLTNELLKLPNKRFAVWGVTRMVETDTSRYGTISIRTAQNKAVISSAEFNVNASNPRFGHIQIYEKPLLDGVTLMLSYESLAESCGAYGTEDFIVEVGDSLIHIGSEYAMGDGGVLHDYVDYVFPFASDKDKTIDYHYKADENRILYVTNQGELDEKCIWHEQISVQEFEWRDGQLVPYCSEY